MTENSGRLMVAALVAFGVSCAPIAVSSADENCPQARKTLSAPAKFQAMQGGDGASLEKGRALYETQSKPIACKVCHGDQGNGLGDPDFESFPPARNFACAETMKGISDGQLFWIIKNGSPRTSMPAFKDLTTDEAWSLVAYIRSFSR
ncbi:MAG: cytochrome c [Candidatus Nitrohelix vancouverensis]|uniref:Cytochrome c n=1 Tax=Candidatus Nitrohelix vancouverensis TaxID=2705534 RepID=A0A7T0G253_9BACT|nr:MAG: cytochrome c [Candidatus Nitrohelix vancouverensis]